MANEYLMVNTEKNEFGTIGLNKVVFETITAIAVGEDKDVVLPDSTPFYKPINCKVDKNALKINAEIKLCNGRNVNEVTNRVQKKISEAIFEMTALQINNIELKVVGFVF